jgi:hypothetical protein
LVIIDAREAVLEIQPDQLLMTTDDAQLGDGRKLRLSNQPAANPGLGQLTLEDISCFVLTCKPHQGGLAAECGYVQRDVAGTARPPFLHLDLHHGHRGFRRDPGGAAMPVSIEHDVAKGQHARLTEIQQFFHRYSGC